MRISSHSLPSVRSKTTARAVGAISTTRTIISFMRWVFRISSARRKVRGDQRERIVERKLTESIALALGGSLGAIRLRDSSDESKTHLNQSTYSLRPDRKQSKPKMVLNRSHQYATG